MEGLIQSHSFSSSGSKFDLQSLNSELPQVHTHDNFSESLSNQNYVSDPLNMGFIQEEQSSTDPLSLHLSEISSVVISQSPSQQKRVDKKSSLFSDVSSLPNEQIQEQEEQQSLYQIIGSMKRKSTNYSMDYDGQSSTFQFKKKRILDSKQISESINTERMVMQSKLPRRYQTRQQTLKLIDDKFENEMKEMKNLKTMF